MLKPIKGNPGRFLDTDTGKVLNISEYREDDKFDTICIYNHTYDPITDGKQYIFFRDLLRKQAIDTNFTQPSRLGAGERMVVDRIGVSVETTWGDQKKAAALAYEIQQLINGAHLRINVNQLLLTEGPAIKYASGYGFAGSVNASDLSIINVGTPSPAAVSRLLKTQTLTENHEVIGYWTYFARNWADDSGLKPLVQYQQPEPSSNYFIKCWLHGLFKTAVNK